MGLGVRATVRRVRVRLARGAQPFMEEDGARDECARPVHGPIHVDEEAVDLGGVRVIRGRAAHEGLVLVGGVSLALALALRAVRLEGEV